MFEKELSVRKKEGFFFVRAALRAGMFAAVLVASSSCDGTVYVDFKPDAAVAPEILEQILSTPLPDGYSRDGGPPGARPSVVIRTVDWAEPLELGAQAGKLVHRCWYVPEVPFSSSASDFNELEGASGYRLEKLEEISLPNRALPVDGRYPGDAGYPFHRDTVVYIEGGSSGPSGGKSYPELRTWVDSLPAADLSPGLFRFAAAGDMMIGRGVSELLASEGGLEAVFSDTLPVLKAADVTAGNLEGAVTERGTKAIKSTPSGFLRRSSRFSRKPDSIIFLLRITTATTTARQVSLIRLTICGAPG